MNEEQQFYYEVGRSIDGAVESQMFGKPCFKINGKAFMCLFNNCLAFKLSGDSHAEALSLDGAELFDPSGKKRPMKEWVQVPFSQKNHWKHFAGSAAKYVSENALSEEIFKAMAAQLRKPEGEAGKQVATKMNTGNAYINRRAIKELHISTGEKILELGMGNGFFAKEIIAAAQNVHYTGCDYSETMIAEATALNSEFIKNKQAGFYLATTDKLPFADETFHKIFGVNIIYFWEDANRELNEIKRVLKPGGKLVLGIRPKESMQNYPFVQYGFTMYTPAALAEVLEKNGFQLENMIHENEPDQEVNGKKVKVDMLVAVARKP